jgi:hypothetical protein
MNIYWSTDEQKLVGGFTNPTQKESFTFVLRDSLTIGLYLVAPQSTQGTPYVISSLTSGHHIEFGAKRYLTDSSYLISQTTWTEKSSGYYEGTLPLNGASLIAAMSGQTSLTLYAEFTTIDGSGKNYLSTQFEITIIHDVITGAEP